MINFGLFEAGNPVSMLSSPCYEWTVKHYWSHKSWQEKFWERKL